MGGHPVRRQKRWKWDKAFEDALWSPTGEIAWTVRHHLDASKDEAARKLVVLMERLKDPDTVARVPYDVRRQLTSEVANALEELAERAHRFYQQVMEASSVMEASPATSARATKGKGRSRRSKPTRASA